MSQVPDLSRFDQSAAMAIEVARERVEEWDYATDPHGYCHERTTYVALLAEIERLTAENAQLGEWLSRQSTTLTQLRDELEACKDELMHGRRR